MPDRDIVTWNAVLGGCSQNGLGTEAIEIFEQMKALGIFPNKINFLNFYALVAMQGFWIKLGPILIP